MSAIMALVGLVIGAVVMKVLEDGRRRRDATVIANAEAEALRIKNEAIKAAENKQREAMVEAKEAILTARNEWEQEEKERRNDIQKQEHRLQQKEENLDKKTENLEKKEEALALLERNKATLGLTNLHIIPGTAPEALTDLPTPDRVFLGGSSGNMEAILRCALSRNPQVRIVVTAVTLETVAEAVQCFARLGLSDTDMVQIAATRTRKAGGYHLMDAQNPVWILSGEAVVPSSADSITL